MKKYLQVAPVIRYSATQVTMSEHKSTLRHTEKRTQMSSGGNTMSTHYILAQQLLSMNILHTHDGTKSHNLGKATIIFHPLMVWLGDSFLLIYKIKMGIDMCPIFFLSRSLMSRPVSVNPFRCLSDAGTSRALKTIVI